MVEAKARENGIQKRGQRDSTRKLVFNKSKATSPRRLSLLCADDDSELENP